MTFTLEPTRVVFIFRETWEDLRVLREKLSRQLVPGETYASPHWRKTFPMSNMCKEFLRERFHDKTCEEQTLQKCHLRQAKE